MFFLQYSIIIELNELRNDSMFTSIAINKAIPHVPQVWFGPYLRLPNLELLLKASMDFQSKPPCSPGWLWFLIDIK